MSRLGHCFLYRVYSLVLRIKEDDRVKGFKSLKPLARNLIEFSAINNVCRFLSASAIQKIIGKINT
jgi:hypothetical protein